MSLSYFGQASVSDGTHVTSYIDSSSLVSAIQNKDSDPYFDTTSKIGQVYVYYTHQDGRQGKKIVHDATSHAGTVMWTSNARDGTWQKSQVKVFNHDGATSFLYRSNIGTGEDCTHTSGQTILNLS